MSDLTRLKDEPHRFDLFRVMREFERQSPDKPRIGDNTVVAEEVVGLGQDPFLDFPAANISALEQTSRGAPRLHTRFLGFFGPQGALPLSTTEEAYNWGLGRDRSFPRFVDIFTNRFLQLFFRAWADARPVAQRDRPAEDRFARYLGSFSGIGTDATHERDSLEDIGKLPFAGLAGSRIKSARRLAQLLRGLFKLEVSIIERIGSWLSFEPGDRMQLGMRGSALGSDTVLGARAYSINDRFRISIRTRTLEQYMGLLPKGPMANKLADLVFFYLGYRFEYDVELALPAHLAPAVRLGSAGQLGWTSWISPPPAAAGDGKYLSDARFDLVERRRGEQAEQAARSAGAGSTR